MVVKKDKDLTNLVSCGITWLDGRVIFKYGNNKKYSQFYYGICHWTAGVFFFTPLDYIKPTIGMTTIKVDPIDKYCSLAHSCVNVDCKLNQFDLDVFVGQFEGMGGETLGLPKDFGKNPEKADKYNWFNRGKWKHMWRNFVLEVTGGTIGFDAKKYEESE